MSVDLLLVRADASRAIGTGHVMRCLALAHAWQDAGGTVAFAMSESTSPIRQRLLSDSCEVLPLSADTKNDEDAQETIALAGSREANWIVVDGYRFGSEYQQHLKAAGLEVLFVDDYGHAGSYSSDIVLNQNVSATEQWYAKRDPSTKLLLGPKYVLLRREFRNRSARHRVVSPGCHRLLVLMGGSDPHNLSTRVLEALELLDLGGIEVTLVVGGSNPNFDLLEEVSAKSRLMIRVLRDVYCTADLMADADIAISAAGSTCWELCRLGVPALLIDVAENQTAVAETLHNLESAIHLGNWSISRERIAESVMSLIGSPETRKRLSGISRRLVDGNGASRIVAILRSTSFVSVRYAMPEDRRLLWNWANDPEVRAASFSTNPISWETHVQWFDQKIADQNTSLLIAEDEEGNPIGQVRFDRNGKDAELHISLVREKRGAGLGVPTIQAAVGEFFASCDCKRVNAYVKPENLASAKVFERSEFQRLEIANVRGHAALHYIRERV